MVPGPARSAAVYVASPLGFTEPTRVYNVRELVPQLEDRGYRVLDPWRDEKGDLAERIAAAEMLPSEAERLSALEDINHELARRNVALLEESDCVLALLDGPDVDSGTAAEIGYAAALGRPIIGWRSDVRRAGENRATPVNLQVAHLIRDRGGRIVATLPEALEALASVAPAVPTG